MTKKILKWKTIVTMYDFRCVAKVRNTLAKIVALQV